VVVKARRCAQVMATALDENRGEIMGNMKPENVKEPVM
jgi:hypothetical protein